VGKKFRVPKYLNPHCIPYLNLLLLLLLLVVVVVVVVVFSPWAGLGRDQSSVRRQVWLWYAASWASS
jgi:hypothetical protein